MLIRKMTMANPDLRSIKYAVAVAEHLSFRSAAETLNIRQSAVSRRIRKLEETIGVSLFERSSGGVRLTKPGRDFIRDVRHVLWLLDRATDRADRQSRAEAGQLILGFFPSLVSGRLREALKVFRQRSPGVAIELMEGSTADQLEWLRSRRIDVGLLAGGYEAPDLKHFPLWQERTFAALPEEHTLAAAEMLEWRDLRRERLLVRAFAGSTFAYNYLVSRIGADGELPTATQHLAARESVLGLVGAGYGICIVPESEVGATYPGVLFRPIAGDNALLPISVAWLAANDNPALRRFLSLLRQVREGHRS